MIEAYQDSIALHSKFSSRSNVMNLNK